MCSTDFRINQIANLCTVRKYFVKRTNRNDSKMRHNLVKVPTQSQNRKYPSRASFIDIRYKYD